MTSGLSFSLTSLSRFVRQLQVDFAGVHSVKQEDGHRGGFTNALQEVTEANIAQPTEVVPRGGRELQPFGRCFDPVDQQVVGSDIVFYVSGFAVTINVDVVINVRIIITKEGVGGPPDFDAVTSFTVDPSGMGVGAICVDEAFLDGAEFLCESCSVTLEAGECTAGECGDYDQEASNLVATEVR